MLQFSISFGIKFQWFILAHKVLLSQASAYLFSIICLLPACALHFSQVGLRASPWMVMMTLVWCLSAQFALWEALPLSSQGPWLF